MSKSPSHREANARSKTVDNGAIRNINLKKQLGNKFSRPIQKKGSKQKFKIQT